MKYEHLKRKCEICGEEKYCVHIRAVKKGGGITTRYICMNCLRKEWHKEQMMRKKKFQEKKKTNIPNYVERCRHFDTCDNGKHRDCVGCNIWNYLYDIKALQEWCKQQGEDFMLFTMRMHKELID